MNRKYFFENQSSLQRQIVAGGLIAAFAFGTIGSGFVGATEGDNEPLKKKIVELNGPPGAKKSILSNLAVINFRLFCLYLFWQLL